VAGPKIGRPGLLHSDTFLHIALLFFNSHAAAGIYELTSWASETARLRAEKAKKCFKPLTPRLSRIPPPFCFLLFNVFSESVFIRLSVVGLLSFPFLTSSFPGFIIKKRVPPVTMRNIA